MNLRKKIILRNLTQILLLMLFILISSQKIAMANHTYNVLNLWGSPGSGNGQFNFPRGVAVDKNRNVYVCDTLNHRIQVFNDNGVFIRSWGIQGAADGQLSFPYGVAVDNDLDVYVADSSNNRIQKFTNTGTFLAKWGSFGTLDGQFHLPFGIEVDSAAAEVYVVDSKNDRIQVFDTNGNFKRKWGSFGFGIENGKFSRPVDIAIDATRVYVTDQLNSRVQKFTKAGGFVAKWGQLGVNNGQFESPHGIDIFNDTVFIVDSENDRIQKFTSDGDFITSFGVVGTAPGQFDFPTGMAIDIDGSIYVADQWNQRVQKFQVVDGKPGAIIDSVSPQTVASGDPVNFVGHGFDGVITSYQWRSSIDGIISSAASFSKSDLSTGNHTIFFRVQSDTGDWSDEVSTTLNVTAPPPPRFITPTLIWDSGPNNWEWDASKLTIGDFNRDGLSDVAVLYGYETQREVKLFVFLGNNTTGFDPPKEWWGSLPGTWDYSGAKLTSGDYDNDGDADVAILYGFDEERAVAAYVFPSDGTKFLDSVLWWFAGPGNWDWEGSKLTTGDYNGDTIDDIAVLYGYSEQRDVRLFIFPSDQTEFKNSEIWWHAGPGNWDWMGSKITTGDYNNDNKDDMSVFYGYLNEVDVRAFVFPSAGNVFSNSEIWWHAGPGNWDWAKSLPLSQDLDIDTIDDLVIFFDNGGLSMSVFAFPSNGTSQFEATLAWYDSGPGNWNWEASKVGGGDFNGDGEGDLVVLFDYGNARTGLFIFR